MNREEILASVQPLKSDTAVKAWIFKVDSDFYHVAEYQLYRRGKQSSIWTSDKKGKRTSNEPIFHAMGGNYEKCISEFLDKLELEQIENSN